MGAVGTQSVLPFPEGSAARQRQLPIPPILVRNAFSADGRFRYWALRQWSHAPLIYWVLRAPTPPDAENREPTLKALIRRSYAWGYGGILVGCLYPLLVRIGTADMQIRVYRRHLNATGPNEEKRQFQEGAQQLAGMAKALRCKLGVAGWGELDMPNEHRELDVWLEAFGPKPPAWCLGITHDGDPWHPLARSKSHLPMTTPLIPYRYPVPVADDGLKRYERQALRMKEKWAKNGQEWWK